MPVETRRRPADLRWPAAGLTTLLCAALSCSNGEPTASVHNESPLPPHTLSEKLLTPLRQAQNLHHLADLHLLNGDVDRAARALWRVLLLDFPPEAPEADEVQLDARARLAHLLVAQGDTDTASSVIDQGIASATRDSFFLANLYAAKADVETAVARAIDEADPVAAERHRANAIRAMVRAIDINARIQDAILRGVTR